MPRFLILLVIGAVTASASVSGSALAGRPDLARYTLTLNDVPSALGLRAVHAGHVSATDAAKGLTLASFGFDNRGGYELLLMNLKLDGYLDGYRADFLAAGALKNYRPEQPYVASQVSIYADATGAQRVAQLDNLMDRAEDFHCRSLTGSEAVGAESLLCSKTAMIRGHKVVYFAVSWRQGRLRGSLVLTGLAAVFNASEALSLAQNQEARMKTA